MISPTITFASFGEPIFSITDTLAHQAAVRPNKTALVFEGQKLSYAEIMRHVNAIAKQLQDLGIKEGDKVALLMPNHPSLIAAFFAIFALGAVAVPISALFKSFEIRHILNDSNCKAIIVHEQILPELLKALPETSSLEHIVVEKQLDRINNSKTQSPSSPKVIELAKHCSEDGHRVPEINRLSSLAAIIYTSGTTGKPKGAMLSHSSLLSILPTRLNMFDINENDISLLTVPLYHIYGMTIIMMGALAKGATLVMMPKFEAAAALKLIGSEKITLLSAVPTMYALMLDELAKHSYNLNTMRLCFSGSAPLQIEMLAKLERIFKIPVIEAYGMTESACVAAANPLHGLRKAGSVGPALPGIKIEIRDSNDKDLVLGSNQIGEIVINGPNIMMGYHKQQKITAEALTNGWFHTGDLGYLDKDGYLAIVGRLKELIIRGGLNIYPAEIENVLKCLPEISDVAAIGVPDNIMGEIVKAVIVLNPGASLKAQAIKDHCAQYLANYKIPETIEFKEFLPRNATAKVMKYLLN